MTEAVASLSTAQTFPHTFQIILFLELFPEVHTLIGRMSLISEFTTESLKWC